MAIIFKEWSQVEVDGVMAGSYGDVLANYSTRKAEIQSAFRDFRTSEKADRDAKIAKAKADLATEKAAHEATKAEAKAEIDAAKAARDELIAKLGGTDAVQEIKRQQRQAEKAKRLAEIEAEKQRLLEDGE